MAMTVKQLRNALADYPEDWVVHIDMCASTPGIDAEGEMEWEGTRAVRFVDSVRVQAGYEAVALDASSDSA